MDNIEMAAKIFRKAFEPQFDQNAREQIILSHQPSGAIVMKADDTLHVFAIATLLQNDRRANHVTRIMATMLRAALLDVLEFYHITDNYHKMIHERDAIIFDLMDHTKPE